MTPILRTYRNQTWDSEGNLVEDVAVQIDVTADTNADTIRQDARAALALNRAYIALDTPTAARTMAQTKAHARQINGIIRLLLNELEGTD